MPKNNALGMGEQPIGNRYEMVVRAMEDEVNPVTSPGTVLTPPMTSKIRTKPDNSILGPRTMAGGRLDHRGK